MAPLGKGVPTVKAEDTQKNMVLRSRPCCTFSCDSRCTAFFFSPSRDESYSSAFAEPGGLLRYGAQAGSPLFCYTPPLELKPL